jgi:hypothetical protein
MDGSVGWLFVTLSDADADADADGCDVVVPGGALSHPLEDVRDYDLFRAIRTRSIEAQIHVWLTAIRSLCPVSAVGFGLSRDSWLCLPWSALTPHRAIVPSWSCSALASPFVPL